MHFGDALGNVSVIAIQGEKSRYLCFEPPKILIDVISTVDSTDIRHVWGSTKSSGRPFIAPDWLKRPWYCMSVPNLFQCVR